MRSCEIDSIEELSGLSHLHTLDASQNNITDMNETLCVVNDLKCLTNLVLSENPICDDKFYLAKILEATLSNRLSFLDRRGVEDSDYQIVIDATEKPDEINSHALSEKVQNNYKHRIETLHKSQSKGDITVNDPIVARLLEEAEGDLGHQMNSLVNYVREIAGSSADDPSANQR